MNVPEGMIEEEVTEVIQSIVDQMAPKYTFYGYTVSDLKQEAFIICLEALNRYEPGRPLENFLRVNLSNRLKTFVRDNYFTGSASEDRKRVAQPAQLDYENYIVDGKGSFSIDYDDIETKEMIAAIDEFIPANTRMDYLKLINDVYVGKQRREEVIEIVKQILSEHGYYEEG